MLPTALYRARDVAEIDRRAIDVAGIPGIELMERAGREAFRLLRERWPAARRVTVVAGPGNNGGDGFVVARLAAAEGLAVSVRLVGDEARIAGDAGAAYRRMLDGTPGPTSGPGAADDTDVVVDALFGTGLTREISGPAAEAVGAINASPAPVLALDVPSGIHADTGRELGCAVRAAVTVSFIGLKQGLFTREGRECAGEIAYRDLGVPERVFADVEVSARRVALEDCAGLIGPRRRDAHKGRFGHVLVVGGDRGFAGAARLAGEAAGRTGAGLVSVATRREHVAAMVGARPEMMVHGIETPDALAPLVDRASVIAVGPGLGRREWGASMLARAAATDRPLVIDADAINLLADGAVEWPGDATRTVVYTPHPGRRAGCSESPRETSSPIGSQRRGPSRGRTPARGSSRAPAPSSPQRGRCRGCARAVTRAWRAAGWVTCSPVSWRHCSHRGAAPSTPHRRAPACTPRPATSRRETASAACSRAT